MEKEYQNSIMTPERSDSVCKEASLHDNSVSQPKHPTGLKFLFLKNVLVMSYLILSRAITTNVE